METLMMYCGLYSTCLVYDWKEYNMIDCLLLCLLSHVVGSFPTILVQNLPMVGNEKVRLSVAGFITDCRWWKTVYPRVGAPPSSWRLMTIVPNLLKSSQIGHHVYYPVHSMKMSCSSPRDYLILVMLDLSSIIQSVLNWHNSRPPLWTKTWGHCGPFLSLTLGRMLVI